MTLGTLYGIGVGPGDPELITLKAARLIQRARCIAYTVDENGHSLAQDIVAAHLNADQTRIALHFAMSRDYPTRLEGRRRAAEDVLCHLEKGEDVVFITEGDPLLYSTFQHLWKALPADTPVEICPGVSSLFAVAAVAHFPLVIEDESLHVTTAQRVLADGLQKHLQPGDTLVIFKVGKYLERIVEVLKVYGALENAILVQRAGQPDQVVSTDLCSWKGTQLSYFSILLVHTPESDG